MPPRRKGSSATYEPRPDDTVSKDESSHGLGRPSQGIRVVATKVKDINRPGTGRSNEKEQAKESQQENLATSRHQTSKRRGSNVLAPRQTNTIVPIQMHSSPLNAAQSTLKVKGGLDTISAWADCQEMATRLELKQNQALSLRSSTRTRKVVCYNEQSPANHPSKQNPPTSFKPKAKAAVKRNASSVLLLSGAAKRVKEDPSSKIEEMAFTPATTSHVKRTRTRDQALTLHQGPVDETVTNADKNSLLQEVFGVAPATTSYLKRGKTRHQELKSLQSQVDENLPAVMNGDKILVLQTALQMSSRSRRVHSSETAMISEALEGPKSATAIKHEKKNNMAITMNADVNPDYIVCNQRKKKNSKKVSNTPPESEVFDESTSLDVVVPTSEVIKKSVQVLKLVSGGESQKAAKEKKGNSRQMAMSNAAEVNLLVASNVEPEEGFGIAQSTDADKKMHFEAQEKGSKITIRGRDLPGAQVDEEGNVKDLELPLIRVATSALVGIGRDPMQDCKFVEEGGVQELSNGGKNAQCQTQPQGRRPLSKKMHSEALKKGSEAMTRERDLPGAQVDEEGNAKDLKLPLVQVAMSAFAGIGHDPMKHCKSLEKDGAQELPSGRKNARCQTQPRRSRPLTKKMHTEALKKGSKDVTREIDLPGAQVDEESNAKNLELPLVQAATSALVGIGNEPIQHCKPLEKDGAQELPNGGKNAQCQTQSKGRKHLIRNIVSHRTKRNEMENARVSELPSVQIEDCHGSMTDFTMEETYGTDGSTIEAKKLHVKMQENEKGFSRKRNSQGENDNDQEPKMEMPLLQWASNVPIRKVDDCRTSMDGKSQTRGTIKTKKTSGNTHQAKKRKTSKSLSVDTFSLVSSPKSSIEGAGTAEKQENSKVIPGVDPRDWSAVDISNFGSKFEASSEKKRKEEGRRKRAMKFDALPVGFGLGISCWSPSPPKSHGQELQEEITLPELRISMIETQDQLGHLRVEAEKQPYSHMQDMNFQPVDHLSANLAPEMKEMGFSARDAHVLDSAPDRGASRQGGKIKVKRPAGGKTKKINMTLASSPQAVLKSSSDTNGLDSAPDRGASPQGGKVKKVKRPAGGKTKKINMTLASSPQVVLKSSSDANGLDSAPNKGASPQGGKAKVERQAGSKIKKTNLTLASPQAVLKSSSDDMLEEKRMEPGNDGSRTRLRPSRRTTTHVTRTTRSTRR